MKIIWNKRIQLRDNWTVSYNTKMITNDFDLLWDVYDNGEVYDMLGDSQFYNHFPNNSELTTKSGLAKNLMANISQASIHPDLYFPRSYDFGESKQIDEFTQDFYKTALMSSLKKHVEYFWKQNKDALEFIDMEMQSIDPGKTPILPYSLTPL